ncbi:MAG: Ig-like domain-containing protein [Proteobacteria bacterium]|nr:Ig-like domain-containing protein [Pseudomonadota bacterium]
MRKTGILTALLALATLAGCGGDDSFGGGGAGPGAPGTVSAVTVITDAPNIPSSGTTPANISALVRDANNQFVKGVPVLFSTTSGGLAVVNAVTDDTGIAKATLSSPGDKTNRTITVTATVGGGITGQVTVAVSGTALNIQGPDALITATAGSYEVVLTDSANNAVAGQAITLTTAPAATLSPASVTTDGNGRASFTMTPASGTSVLITATGAGATFSKTVTVSADNFNFTSPAADSQYGLAPGAPATLSTTWTSGGAPVNAGTVTFSTTRGTFTTPSAVTPVNGVAGVSLTSTTAGEAVVTATNSNGGTTQRRIFFVASTPSQIDVQANPFTVAINQTSTVTAVVRDANNNLVAGQTVVFSLVDPTGGSLSVGSAVTDLQGRATSVYRASSTASASNGVHVSASVGGVTDTVDLTVAGSALFLSFGTGNTILEVNNDTQYKLDYTVQVTDSTGAGVSGVTVSLSALSWNYIKGFRALPLAPSTGTWFTQANATCINEDRVTGNLAFDFNGILDPGENQNGNNNSGVPSMEAGNIATVTPGTGTTDANGFCNSPSTTRRTTLNTCRSCCRLRTAVQGTEFARTTLPFLLPASAPDFNNRNSSPPGLTSPFGQSASCSDFN